VRGIIDEIRRIEVDRELYGLKYGSRRTLRWLPAVSPDNPRPEMDSTICRLSASGRKPKHQANGGEGNAFHNVRSETISLHSVDEQLDRQGRSANVASYSRTIADGYQPSCPVSPHGPEQETKSRSD
jgi:hypothetical protein